jgi:predicted alpha/beta-hydrolase family hydrolase
MIEQLVSTPVGQARIDWYQARGVARAVLVLGHGSATGVECADLQAIATVLPSQGITVALVTQPYRLERGSRASDEPSLDLAWQAVWPEVAGSGLPIVAGGRSAGSQVACRTAKTLGARAVLILSYPLLGPGSPQELVATGLPVLIVQGGRDPYGRPDQFPPLPPSAQLVDIPFANHTFGVPPDSDITPAATLATITDNVSEWLDGLLSRAG